MRLAILCGESDWRGLIDRLGHSRFAEWCAYDTIEPLNHQQHMLGMIAHMLSSALGKPANDDAVLNACLPWLDDKPQMATAEDFRAQVAGLRGT